LSSKSDEPTQKVRRENERDIKSEIRELRSRLEKIERKGIEQEKIISRLLYENSELKRDNLYLRVKIESPIIENNYPLESDIKPEHIKKIKRIHKEIQKNKGTAYNSMEEFLDSL
jgi:hypothetical protein